MLKSAVSIAVVISNYCIAHDFKNLLLDLTQSGTAKRKNTKRSHRKVGEDCDKIPPLKKRSKSTKPVTCCAQQIQIDCSKYR